MNCFACCFEPSVQRNQAFVELTIEGQSIELTLPMFQQFVHALQDARGRLS